jgi:cbb3-type cytochrome oxidase cytochrome c subunit
MGRAAGFALALLLGALVAASDGQPTAELGKQQFVNNGCHGCHMVGKMGTPIGPDLSRIGSKYSRAYIERWLRDPAAQRPNAHMPALELTEDQVKALAAFLASLR